MLYCINNDLKVAEYKKLPHQFEAVPNSVLAPCSQNTAIGELQFNGGIPTGDSIRRLCDYQNFHTHVNATLHCVPIAVFSELTNNLKALGLGDNDVGVFMQGVDSSSLLAVANPGVIYALTSLDVSHVPLVIETPPATIGSLYNAALSSFSDTGYTGPDKGKGGKYLLVGPDWQGSFNEKDYTAVLFSDSYRNCLVLRGFLSVSDSETIIENFSEHLKIYPLGEAPRRSTLHNLSGVKFSALPAYDETMFDQINSVVQSEHKGLLSEHVAELLQKVGIQKGKPFLRDMDKNQLLKEAAVVAFATVRTKLYYPEQKSRYLHPGRQWFVVTTDGFRQATTYNHGDVRDDIGPYMLPVADYASNSGTKNLFELACMSLKDNEDELLHGSKPYRVRLPAAIKTDASWQITLYDSLHWSMLITDQLLPVLGSKNAKLQRNGDGSIDLYFAPQLPEEGCAANWIKTDPNAYWFAIFRVTSKQNSWRTKSWKMQDIELIL